MRGNYEASNDRHPFTVQYVGLNDVCIRNLTTDEIVARETKVSEAGDPSRSLAQWNRLDAKALSLARELRGQAIEKPLASRPHESDGKPRESLHEAVARIAKPSRTFLAAAIMT